MWALAKIAAAVLLRIVLIPLLLGVAMAIVCAFIPSRPLDSVAIELPPEVLDKSIHGSRQGSRPRYGFREFMKQPRLLWSAILHWHAFTLALIVTLPFRTVVKIRFVWWPALQRRFSAK